MHGWKESKWDVNFIAMRYYTLVAVEKNVLFLWNVKRRKAKLEAHEFIKAIFVGVRGQQRRNNNQKA